MSNIFTENSDSLILRDEDVSVHAIQKLPMSISLKKADSVDTRVISSKYFNSFNFFNLPSAFQQSKVAFGIISANKGEGKTLVASNMAVALARAYKQKTVIVDLNFKSPQLHNIFGVHKGPGIVDAILDDKLTVAQTEFEHLYLLPIGGDERYTPNIDDGSVLHNIISTLKTEFDFIIVDMFPIFPTKNSPIIFANVLDGLIGVIDTQKTKKEEINRIYRHVNEDQMAGYIFNKVKD